MSHQSNKSGESFADGVGQAADILIQHQMDECRAQRVLAQERDRNAQHGYLELEQKYKSLYCSHAAQERTIEQLQEQVHKLQATVTALLEERETNDVALKDQQHLIQHLQHDVNLWEDDFKKAEESIASFVEQRDAAARRHNKEKRELLGHFDDTIRTLRALTSRRPTKPTILEALETLQARLVKFRERI